LQVGRLFLFNKKQLQYLEQYLEYKTKSHKNYSNYFKCTHSITPSHITGKGHRLIGCYFNTLQLKTQSCMIKNQESGINNQNQELGM